MKAKIKITSGIITTLVVVFALASVSCSMTGVSGLLATETPVPTFTFTPTPTLIPSPTFTPSPTPSPTPRPTGVAALPQADGSTVFMDYDNRFQLALPADWAVILIDKETISETIDQLSKENPNLASSAEVFRNVDSKNLRMAALNTNSVYIASGYAPNVTVGIIEDRRLTSMPLSSVVDVMEESFTNQKLKVLTHDVNTVENAHQVAIEYVDIVQAASGKLIFQRIMMFKTGRKLFLITVTSVQEFREDIFKIGEQIGASVEFLK